MKNISTIAIIKEGKWFVAKSLELGVVSQGKTLEQAKKNLAEAISLYLEGSPKAIKLLQKDRAIVTTLEFSHA